MTKSQIRSLIDQLGDLRAQIAPLKELEEELVTRLKKAGVGSYSGDLYDCTIYSQERSTTNWSELAEKLKIPQKTIDRYTSDRTSICLKITARDAT